MNNDSYRQVEMQINLKEVIWDLLEQWKAVLITALLMALLVAGAKYYKDSNAYKTSMHAKEDIVQSGVTAEDQIKDILASLPEDEVATVEYMVTQDEWIENQKEYLNNSILMNTNPANQRTLLLDYYISISDAAEAKMTALIFGYVGYLKDEDLVNSIGQAIDPSAKTRYIAELISVSGDNSRNGNFSGNSGSLAVDTDADGAILEVRVVLPDDADSVAVEKAMTSALSKYTPELNNKICKHNISLIKSIESFVYNTAAVNNRSSITSSVYNMQNNAKNMQSSLSDEQKSAIESIIAIKRDAESGDKGAETIISDGNKSMNEEELPKPGFSKKYALLGFVLGCMAYAFIYLMMIIAKGQVNYAGDAELYTQSRLLGEIYEKSEHKGLGALLHSGMVNKYRYGKKQDADTQTKKAVETISAVAEYVGCSEMTLINFTGTKSDKAIAQVISDLTDNGLVITQKTVEENNSEKEILDIKKAVLTVDKSTKVSELVKLVGLCREYGVDILGTLYFGSIGD